MQMTTDARRWLDETVARILSRHTLREPERGGVHYELMSHLHAAAERKAQDAGASQVTPLHLQQALQEMGGEDALAQAFVLPHARQLPRAGFWKRSFAYLIDLLIVGLAAEALWAIVTLLLLGPILGWRYSAPWDAYDATDPTSLFEILSSANPVDALLVLPFVLALLALTVAYYAYMEATRQQTLGKMALRLRVARAEGGALGAREAILRNLVKVNAGLVALDALIMLLFLREERQRLSDRVADTAVFEE